MHEDMNCLSEFRPIRPFGSPGFPAGRDRVAATGSPAGEQFLIFYHFYRCVAKFKT